MFCVSGVELLTDRIYTNWLFALCFRWWVVNR